MVVDLPAPFGPRKPTISPSFTEKEILFTAFCCPYCLLRPAISNDMELVLALTAKLINPCKRALKQRSKMEK